MTEKVRLVGDPVLKKPCEVIPAENITLCKLQPIIDQMIATMKAENGIGLAANQIGHGIRLFILRNEDATISEFINPEIVEAVNPTQFEGEACLSVPGVHTTTTRYQSITLKWTTKTGFERQEQFHNLRAFAVQHEMDHLNGKLYLDQFGPVKQGLLLKKHKKFLKQAGRK